MDGRVFPTPITARSVFAALLAIGVIAPARAGAADLLPATIAAFDRYVAATEVRATAPTPPLHIDSLTANVRQEAMQDLQARRPVIEKLTTREDGKEIDVPGGMIHHWVGTIFIPGTSIEAVVRLLQDYDHHAEVFSPMVQRSRVLSRDGDDHFTVFLRFYQKKGLAVTVNSDHESWFTRLASDQVAAKVVSTRIQEVENADTPDEREKPVGQDGGYLWRLNTYWRSVQRDGGVYVQCESVTLTRDLPFGLGWLIGPFVTSIPRDSLSFTLETTRRTLLQQLAVGR